jgi:hypothetical protein
LILKKEIAGVTFGFGLRWSKIKGFEGTIQQDWQLALVNTNLFQT